MGIHEKENLRFVYSLNNNIRELGITFNAVKVNPTVFVHIFLYIILNGKDFFLSFRL